MRTRRLLPSLFLAVLGLSLTLVTVGMGEAPHQTVSVRASSSELPHRAFVPHLAADSRAGGPPPVQPTLTPTATPTSTGTVTKTPTATATPTATPTAPSGGGLSCVASQQTFDWLLCVTNPSFPGNPFDIVVVPLTEEALESFSFKVRVYKPDDFLGDDSFSQYPFYVGQQIRLYYPYYDFFLFDDELPPGTYEVELRVDFLHEVSVFVFVN